MSAAINKIQFKALPSEWVLSFCYLFSLSLTGLGLWFFFAISLFLLIDSFLKKREEFLVQFFILVNYSAFIGNDQFPYFSYMVLFISVVLLIIYRYSKVIRIINWTILVYFIGIVFISTLSSEPLFSQLKLMRVYFGIISYIIPVVLLKESNVSFMEIGRILILYTLLISFFAVVDGFILNGFFFLPNSYLNGEQGVSTWNHLYIAPFSTRFPRIYPHALYLMFVSVYFIARYYRLNIFYWVILLLTIAACRTMSFYAGVVVLYLFALPNRRIVYRGLILVAIVGMILYYVDKNYGGFLRIASTVEQFNGISEAVETEDIERMAEFGSSRVAQAYPKMEMLISEGKLWRGFGFIDFSKVSMNLLMKNMLYLDQSEGSSVEMPSQVEITQIQTILEVGLGGLIFQALIYIFICMVLHRFRYEWQMFAGCLIGVSISGLGGFVGLTTSYVLWVGLALGISLLHRCPKEQSSEIKVTTEITAK